jgi:hypothetical protein
MTESLMWANICIERIDRALRQHARLQKAYGKQSREFDRLVKLNGGQPPRPLPESWTDLEARFQDHLYFFVLTARQGLKAAWVLEERGELMPSFRQQDQLRAWRDFLEHWDRPARGQRHTAGEDWKQVSDEEEPGLSLGGVGGRLHEVSGVKLRKLKKDLKRARKVAGEVSEREWNYCYMTAEEAAEVLGMTLDEFEEQRMKPTHIDFRGEEGVRYLRDWVEARRDGALIPPGWEPYV